jgi:hypothetical protein
MGKRQTSLISNVYEVTDRPALGSGHRIVLADDTAFGPGLLRGLATLAIAAYTGLVRKPTHPPPSRPHGLGPAQTNTAPSNTASPPASDGIIVPEFDKDGRRTRCSGVRVGLWCGRQLRSVIPSTPSSR